MLINEKSNSDDQLIQGKVLWCIGNQARVLVSDEQNMVDFPGRWRLEKPGVQPVVPGDSVSLQIKNDSWRLVEVLPRMNEFTRALPGTKNRLPQIIASNLDLVSVTVALAEPATPYGLVDRLFVVAEQGEVPSILVLNKTDLVDQAEIETWRKLYRGATQEIIAVSGSTGDGIETLHDLIKGKTVLFAGRSGVGKSTIANCIDPDLNLKTSEVSQATGKGRHTTSATEFHPVSSGGWIADTPGLRECAPWGITSANLQDYFPEITRIAGNCRFRDCKHKSETGCVILKAVGTSELPEERFQSYLKLLSETENVRAPHRKGKM